jgi:hypothetical protein
VSALGPYLVACATLVAAGLAKTLRPANTSRALTALVPSLPARLVARGVRVAAAVEVALGFAAALQPRPALAGAVATSYLAFAGFVVFARTRGGVLASCGCFGTPDTPATRLHVVLNLCLASAAVVVAAADPGSSLVAVLGHQPLSGGPLLGAAGAGTALVIAAMTSLPRLSAVRTRLSLASHRIELVDGPSGPTRP